MRKLIQILAITLLTVIMMPLSVAAQITLPFPDFSTPTILRAEVEANDETLASTALNRTGGTMTGALAGTSATFSSTLAVTGAVTLSSTLAAGATTVTTLASGAITASGHILPGSANVYDLGASGTRFDELFVRTINASLNTTLSGTLTVSGAQTFVGNTELRGTLSDSTGNLTIGDATDFTGNMALTGTFTVSGDVADSDSAFTIADTLSVTGFGAHAFTAGGTGGNLVKVQNSTNGTTEYAGFVVEGNGASATLTARMNNGSFTTSGPDVASGGTLAANSTGGLTLAATHASGSIRFYVSSDEDAIINNSGLLVKRDVIAGFSLATSGIGVSGNVLAYAASGPALYLLFDDTSASQDGFSLQGDNGDQLRFVDWTAGTGTVRFTMQGSGELRSISGTAGAPAYGFTSNTDTGIYYNNSGPSVDIAVDSTTVLLARLSSGNGIVDVTRGGSTAIQLDGGNMWVTVNSTAIGTGARAGGGAYIGRNTSGGGAAGWVGLTEGDGSATQYLWPDNTGLIRINTAQPEEDGTPAHNSGTVLGDQTSQRSAKWILQERTDFDAMLQTVLDAPLFDFIYRDGRYNSERFTGITTDDSPLFGKDQGKALNEVTTLGYLIGATKALEARVRALEAQQQALR